MADIDYFEIGLRKWVVRQMIRLGKTQEVDLDDADTILEWIKGKDKPVLETRYDDLKRALEELRQAHAYLKEGTITDQCSLAEGWIAPAIRALEHYFKEQGI